MIFGRKGIVGLDIGSSTLKLAELKQSRGKYRLVNVGEAFLPHDTIVDKQIVNPSVASEYIYNLFNDLGIKNKNVVISVSGNSVIIRRVTLPQMSEAELSEAVPWELEQYLPQTIADVNYDYQVLPGVTPEGNIDVVIVAAKKDITSSYVNLVADIGLNPVVVDVDVFAMENMYEMNYEPSDGLVALVNIGASTTNINILKSGITLFTRDIGTGGNQFTELLMNQLNVDFEEAETTKLTLSGNDEQQEFEHVIREFSELVSEEIRKTLDFFENNVLKESVIKIVLGGGSSKVTGLRDYLSESLEQTEVMMINPFRNIEISESDFDPEYMEDIAPKMGIVIGLALRNGGNS